MRIWHVCLWTVQDNYPLMHSVALDLSPYYLQEARENVRYWQRMTASSGAVVGGTEFLHAAAESIPMENESCDVVRTPLCPHLN
jgi:ubiquinone/menaquinone biosynthesis C-methylase UbiE